MKFACGVAMMDGDKAVLVRRGDGRGFGFPFGKVDEEDAGNLRRAAARELLEETGYGVDPDDLIHIYEDGGYPFHKVLFALRPGAPFTRGQPRPEEKGEVVLSSDPVSVLGDPMNGFRHYNLAGWEAFRKACS